MRLTGISIIPTGLGCSIGGDAAANPVAKLLASCCNRLIVNANHVNASDINELPANAWYLEGSTIDRLLEGTISLDAPRTPCNRILMLVNQITPETENTANAAIWGLGADVEIMELKTPLLMTTGINDDSTAGGKVEGYLELIDQIKGHPCDCIALQTPILCPTRVSDAYWHGGIQVNPWGAVEAMVSKVLSTALNKQVVHAPTSDNDFDVLYKTLAVRQQQAPEVISNTYSFCIFKGLHRAPRISPGWKMCGLWRNDIDFLISPAGCWGRPHRAALKAEIPIIVVKENKTVLPNPIYPKSVIFAETYLEAAGILMSLEAGVCLKTLRS